MASTMLVVTEVTVAGLICVVYLVLARFAPLRLQSEPFQLQHKVLEFAELIARSTELRPTSAADILNTQIKLLLGHPAQSKGPPR